MGQQHQTPQPKEGETVSNTNAFLITGLPRSRTAWMSMYFQGLRNTKCLHEPVRHLPTKESIQEYLSNKPEGFNEYSKYYRGVTSYRGISTSGFTMWEDECKELFYKGKCVIILREPIDVIMSLSKMEGVRDTEDNTRITYNQMNELLLQTAQNYLRMDTITVPYEELDCKETMKMVHQHLVPTVEWCEDYWEQMNELNITINERKSIMVEKPKLAEYQKLNPEKETLQDKLLYKVKEMLGEVE